MWYAVLAAYIVDRVGSVVWVEFDGIVWASLLVAFEPDKSTEVDFARADAGLCKFANSKEDISVHMAEQNRRRLCPSSMICLS